MGNIIISGSNGFIGTALKTYFEKQGKTVIGIPRLTLYNRDKLRGFLTAGNPEIIIHTAAYGNMAQHDNIDDIITTNIACTWNLLIASKDIPYKAFINFGSSSEYGKKLVPMREDLLPTPDSFYGASKVASTMLCRAAAYQYNKPIVTVRPFSVYGPGEASYRFIPTIVRSLKNYEEMYVDINGVHDWIYIDDVVEAIAQIVDMPEIAKDGAVFNLGTGKQTTNLQIVNTLEDISRRILTIKTKGNMRPNDSQMWMDGSTEITNLLRGIGWKPKVSLYEGLKNCYDYYE